MYDPAADFLQESLSRLRTLKALAERAVAQVSDEELFRLPRPDDNSIALIMKHMAGNMRSRWTDFLTTDGEKPDRHRDTEFEQTAEDTPEALRARWEAGWQVLFDALTPLTPADLGRTVTIRGEPHTVLAALLRQLSHYAYHVGQIVWLARHFRGEAWQSLSIPRGQSTDYRPTPP